LRLLDRAGHGLARGVVAGDRAVLHVAERGDRVERAIHDELDPQVGREVVDDAAGNAGGGAGRGKRLGRRARFGLRRRAEQEVPAPVWRTCPGATTSTAT
jgi:hypothetical protein